MYILIDREIMHVILLVDGGNLRQHPNKVLPDNYITFSYVYWI